MRQLDLFGDPAPLPPAPPPAPEPEIRLPDLPDVLPGQIGLFDPRSLHLGRARAAVAAGDLDAACRELDALRARCPDDPEVAREALEIHGLRQRLARIAGPRTKHRARALLGVVNEIARASEPLASLRKRLLGRVAAEIQRQHGDAGELEGRLAGEYLVEAGDLEEAQASFVATFASTQEPRALFLLGDVAWGRGDTAAARRVYLGALLLDPFSPALGAVRDDEVRALPALVRDDLEIEDEPEAWAAPAGILDGVLPRAGPEETAALPPPRSEALARAPAFVEALQAAPGARGDAAVEIRRTMKRLSPRLFELYMDRVVRSRSG